LGKITIRVVLTVLIGLQEYCSGGNKGSIGGYGKLSGRIKVSKDWLVKGAIFQSQK
jgi:hypothetical protein